MLLSYATTLAEARSHLAALADTAATFDAQVTYEHVLLQLDLIHGDDGPGLHAVDPTDRDSLYTATETALEELVDHGADALRVELLLAMLNAALAKDAP